MCVQNNESKREERRDSCAYYLFTHHILVFASYSYLEKALEKEIKEELRNEFITIYIDRYVFIALYGGKTSSHPNEIVHTKRDEIFKRRSKLFVCSF